MSARTLLFSVLIASWLTPSLGHADDWATVATGQGSQNNDRAISDGLGGAYFTWIDVLAYAGSSLRVTRITDAGVPSAGWSVNGRIPTVTDERRAYSQLVADGTGGVFIGWQRLGLLGGTTFDVYLQRLTGDGQIAPGWPDQGLLVAPVTPKTPSLTLTPDGAGGVFLTWFARVSSGDYRVYAQRITGAGTVAAGWPASGVGVSSMENTQLFERACPDGQGGLLVVWSAGPSGGDKDIYAQHLLADGSLAPGWPSTGIPVCTATGSQESNAIASFMVSDGAGGFICTWQDARSGNKDIYAQRMNGSGSIAVGWPADGIALTTAADDQVHPVIETDDAGGAFIAWDDYSKNSNPSTTDQTDVYAHHVLGNGTLAGGWPAGGFVLSNASQIQENARIVRDGSGGAYFVWNDSGRAAGTRIGPSGVVYAGWGVNGTKIGTYGAYNYPFSPVLHPSGDLILGYSISDYYAARIHGDGTTSGQPTSVGPGATLSSKIGVAPHPMGERAEFSLTLRGGEPATLELFAIDGRRVWQREVGSLGAGRHTVPFAASGTLPAGVYRLRLSEGTTSVTRQLVRIR